MSRISIPYDISNYTYDDPNFISNLAAMISALGNAVNGQLTFSDNFNCSILTCTFNKANIQQVFSHGLLRIPKGYIVIGSLAATNIYNGSTPNTSNLIYLNSTSATSVNMIVF